MSRRYGPSNRPRAQARPGASPRPAAPPRRNRRAESARRRSTDSRPPSQPQITRQPRRRLRTPRYVAEQQAPQAARAREPERDPRLRLVGEPDHVGQRLALRQRADRVAPRGEVGCHPALVAACLRRRADAHAHLGDRPEDPLGAERELAQRRPRRRVRGGERAQLTGRGDHREGGYELVEASVAARRLAGGPRRREAADGRVLERLREMADREPVRAHGVLGLGAAQTRSEGGDERDAVDLDAAHPAQIQRDQALVRAGDRVDAADHAGSAAERDHRDPLARADLEHVGELGRLAGHDHRVGRRGQAPAAQADQVGIAASRRSPHPLLVCDQDARLVHRVDDRIGQRARRGERDLVELDRSHRLRLAELRAQHLQRRRRQRHPPLGVAPPRPLRRPRGPLRGLRHPAHPPAPARCPRAPPRVVAERRPASSSSPAARAREAAPRSSASPGWRPRRDRARSRASMP